MADSPTPGILPSYLVDRIEASRLLNVCPNTVSNLVAAGKLGSVKIGARRLFDRAEILAFIERSKEGRA